MNSERATTSADRRVARRPSEPAANLRDGFRKKNYLRSAITRHNRAASAVIVLPTNSIPLIAANLCPVDRGNTDAGYRESLSRPHATNEQNTSVVFSQRSPRGSRRNEQNRWAGSGDTSRPRDTEECRGNTRSLRRARDFPVRLRTRLFIGT